MFRKVLAVTAALVCSFSLSFRDVVLLKDGGVMQGQFGDVSGTTLILRSDNAVYKYALSDVKGFCVDGSDAVFRSNSGEQTVGVYSGVNDKEIIFRVGFQYVSVVINDLQYVYSLSIKSVGQTIVGMQNGILLSGYSPINLQIATISSGLPLPSALYTAGEYIESFKNISSRFDIGFGAAFTYVPTASVNLLNPDTGNFYGTLSVDTMKVEFSIGGYFTIIPALKVGVSVTPTVNVSSLYETFATNTSDNVYITHSTVGIRPALEIRYTIMNSLSLGLTAGYEVLSTCDGIVVRVETGYAY
jgi:hypothetical protein